MVIDAQHRDKLNKLVRQIDDGTLARAPHVPGHPGVFLRERVAWVRDRRQWLTDQGVSVHGAGPEISGGGELCGPIRLRPLHPPKVHTQSNEHLQQAVATAVSEELGGIVNVVMWLSGTSGMDAYNVLRDSEEQHNDGCGLSEQQGSEGEHWSSVEMSGDVLLRASVSG